MLKSLCDRQSQQLRGQGRDVVGVTFRSWFDKPGSRTFRGRQEHAGDFEKKQRGGTRNFNTLPKEAADTDVSWYQITPYLISV